MNSRNQPEEPCADCTPFEQLAHRHKDAVYRQMVRVCGNREDAEDVLIEALLKAYRSLDALSAHEAFRTWLGRIASRVCWQLRKKQSLLPLLQLSALQEQGFDLADPVPSAETQAASAQLKQMLREALDSLPADYRAVYELRAIEALSGEETAQRLGLSVAAMKSRWHRARALLRDRLDEALAPRNRNPESHSKIRRNTVIEVKVRHQGDVKFEVAARQHIILSDQPAENGGSDQGMTPPELFLAGLGSCAAFYAAAWLKKKNLSREGLAVRVTAEKAGPPARIDPIHIDVEISIPLSEAERAGLDDAVHRCLVHNTLAHPPKVHIQLHTPVAA